MRTLHFTVCLFVVIALTFAACDSGKEAAPLTQVKSAVENTVAVDDAASTGTVSNNISSEEQSVIEPATQEQQPGVEASEKPTSTALEIRSILDGWIEAESYDPGGEGFGFHDMTANNEGGKGDRNDAVDIVNHKPGLFCVGYIRTGEWLAYTLRVPETGFYQADVKISTPLDDRRFHLEAGGKTVARGKVANTGAWDEPSTLTLSSFELSSGTHTFKLVFESDRMDFDKFRIVRVSKGWEKDAESVTAKAQWEHSRAGAAGTTITLSGMLDDGRWSSTMLTGADGAAEIMIPRQAASIQLLADHEDAEKPVELSLTPGDFPATISLIRRGAIYGTVTYADDPQRNGAGAQVRSLKGDLETTADDEGSFRIGLKDQKEVQLIAILGVHSSFTDEKDIENIVIVPHEDNGPIRLTLKDGSLIEGLILDESTQAGIPDAKINGRDSIRRIDAASDADGHYYIAGLIGSDLRLDVSKDGYVSQELTLNTALNKRSQVNIELEPGGSVAACVIDENQTPVEGAHIQYIIQQGRSQSWHSTNETTGPDGTAVVKNVSRKNPPLILAQKSGYKQSERVLAQFGEEEMSTSVTLVLLPSDSTADDNKEQKLGWFTGTVTDKASGGPIANATVAWGREYQIQRLDNNVDKTQTDEQGHYELQCDTRDIYRYLVCIAEGKGRVLKSQVRPGVEEDPAIVDFQLEDSHWLEIKVVDEEEQPVADCRLSIMQPATSPYGHISGVDISTEKSLVTDASGMLYVDDLPGPTVRVSVLIQQSPGTYRSDQTETYSVDQSITIKLNPTGVLLGRVIDDETEKPVEKFYVKTSYSSNNEQMIIDADGRFKLTSLKLSNQETVIIRAEGYAPLSNAALTPQREENAEEVVFRLKKTSQISVQLLDAAAATPIAGAAVVSARMRSDYQQHFNNVNGINLDWDRIKNLDFYYFEDYKRHMTDAEGRFEFEHGKTIFICVPDYVRLYLDSARQAQYKQDDGELRIMLQRGGSIAGRFALSVVPQPNIDFSLRLSPPQGYGQSMGSTRSDSQGEFIFTGLDAGRYSINFSRTLIDGYYNGYTISTELGEGEDQYIDLEPKFGYLALTGNVWLGDRRIGSDVGISLTRKDDSNFTFQGRTNSRSEYRIEDLPPGEYTARCSYYDQSIRKHYNDEKEISLSGNEQLDFQFEPVHSIRARLIFPSDMSEETRNKYHSPQLQWDHNSGAQPSGNNIDSYAHNGTLDAGQLEIKGRFKGKYRLMLSYRTATNMSQTKTMPGVYELDNLEQDQDLGDIELPSSGEVKLRLTFARGEDRARVSSVQLVGTAYNQAAQESGIEYSVSGAMNADGEVVFQGRMQGDYRIQLSGTYLSLRLPQRIYMANPDDSIDGGEVQVPPIYKISFNLSAKDPSVFQSYRSLTLNLKPDEGVNINDSSYALTNSASIQPFAQGRIEYYGLFLGSYRIQLYGNSGNLQFPNLIDIDNRYGDQDLGEIKLEGLGNIKVTFNNYDPDHAPQYIMVMLGDPNKLDEVGSQQQLMINGNSGAISGVMVGDYILRFFSPGFRITPMELSISVVENETLELQVSIEPEVLLTVMIMNDAATTSTMPVRQIRMTGQGQDLSLVPEVVTTESAAFFSMIYQSTQSAAISMQGQGTFAIFRNIPAGDYNVEIQADGFETWTGVRTAISGQEAMTQMYSQRIQLTRLP
ncbi:carbohydrate-binding protein [Candidatus Sumerlaeota bacterium]|nr:carbohydrate-binding protein [Candidatus Sumerlaeota bacterium]